MAQKKKSKAKKAVKETKPVKEKPMGFFERNKDILPPQGPPQKTVRVKTFIVEKPIIIHEKPQHINLSADDGEEVTIEDERKKYKKRFRGVELEDSKDADEEESGGALESGEEDSFADDALPDDVGGEDGLGVEGTGEDYAGEEAGIGNVGAQVKSTHVRSHGMIANIWWKKAILWGFFVWVLILILELAMQAIKLVEVDLTRQWWILLAGILVVALIYFGVIESRVKF